MFETMFYYYYLFDRKMAERDPHIWAMLHLSLVEGLILSYFVGSVLVKYYHIVAPTYIGVSMWCLVILFNYLYFIKSDRYVEIIRTEPKFFGSHWLSVLISLSSVVGIFLLYWFD
jgi:hypothetical protein